MRQYIRHQVIALATSILFLCVACTPHTIPGNLIDDLGRPVEIAAEPQRIISLAPSNTEILFALGLEDKVIGVTEFCNYPDAAKAKPKVGGFNTVDIEKVVSLEPDLVLATRIHGKTVIPTLEDLDLAVLALVPSNVDEVLDNISLVGEITGQNRQASQLIADSKKRIEAVLHKTNKLASDQRPPVFYLIWHEPLMTSGAGTLANDIINIAGGQSIAYDIEGDKAINLETVIHRDPQVIIASVSMGTGEDLPWQYVRNEPRFQKTQALLNNRVYKIEGDIIHRPGPRIVEAIEQMAKFIHPELFSD